MVNEMILKNRGFTPNEIKLIKKHFKYIYQLYILNEINIFTLLEYINEIQNEIKITFINNYVLNFEIVKNNKNIYIDILYSSNL